MKKALVVSHIFAALSTAAAVLAVCAVPVVIYCAVMYLWYATGAVGIIGYALCKMSEALMQWSEDILWKAAKREQE